jgi:hypothetical protein
MPDLFDVNNVAITNPAVDAEKLNRLRELQRLLQQAGVLKKADYRLSPALGGSPSKPIPPTNAVIRMT